LKYVQGAERVQGDGQFFPASQLVLHIIFKDSANFFLKNKSAGFVEEKILADGPDPIQGLCVKIVDVLAEIEQFHFKILESLVVDQAQNIVPPFLDGIPEKMTHPVFKILDSVEK
jgi:hypothetical protein